MKPWQVHVAMILVCLTVGGIGIAVYHESQTGREIAGGSAFVTLVAAVKLLWPKKITLR